MVIISIGFQSFSSPKPIPRLVWHVPYRLSTSLLPHPPPLPPPSASLPRLRSNVADSTMPPSTDDDGEDICPLPPGLLRHLMPRHVAVIMDGNRRWAVDRGLPIWSGYSAGFRSLGRLVELCRSWRIPVLSVFAFSSDNWTRPTAEVDFLMGLFENVIRHQLDNFVRNRIRFSVIGDSSRLPEPLKELIADAVKTTENNSRLHLIVAINYSGRNDITQACRRIARKAKDGVINPSDIDEILITEELETSCTESPYPDLLIRTSGELRVSNFLLWQMAYTELFFARSAWPEFGEAQFAEALRSFQQRHRRYGGHT